ncbi:MAG: DUF305 domain-containing protein [Devosia sp.]
MKILATIAVASVLPLLAPASALAADPLPAICSSGQTMMDMSNGMPMTMGPDDDAHRALMAGMGDMNSQMAQGMTAADIDVAFICGMIPHHQGAIDMARAELQYGDDPWAKELAQKIVDAQTREIAEMINWLNKQSP